VARTLGVGLFRGTLAMKSAQGPQQGALLAQNPFAPLVTVDRERRRREKEEAERNRREKKEKKEEKERKRGEKENEETRKREEIRRRKELEDKQDEKRQAERRKELEGKQDEKRQAERKIAAQDLHAVVATILVGAEAIDKDVCRRALSKWLPVGTVRVRAFRPAWAVPRDDGTYLTTPVGAGTPSTSAGSTPCISPRTQVSGGDLHAEIFTAAAESLTAGVAPTELLWSFRWELRALQFMNHIGATPLLQALESRLCKSSACCSSDQCGTTACLPCADGQHCSECAGTGSCRMADWSGRRPCMRCAGAGQLARNGCYMCVKGVVFCKDCLRLREEAVTSRNEQHKLKREVARPCPAPGLRIAEVSATERSMLHKLWLERGGRGEILQAWAVNNPELTWRFEAKQRSLRQALGCDPDLLNGFHGTKDENVLAIVSKGFDAGRRAGQVFGSGEYFAKCPEVSKAYCRGGAYMLVCQLSLGTPSRDSSNKSGDHIWVDSQKYYVVSSPEQALPLYILRFGSEEGACPALLKTLSTPGGWSSMKEAVTSHVPPNRACFMSADTTDALWIGYLRPELDDRQLESDVSSFLDANGCIYAKLQIVRGKFTQAKVRLSHSLSQEHVRLMCSRVFVEADKERRVTVDDAHGSAEQRCPRSIAHYCRGKNLRFVDPCWCTHQNSPTVLASYKLSQLERGTAKWDELASKFLTSAPFHDGQPRLVRINAIQNETLEALHEGYRRYLRQKHGEESKTIELYHGTNNNILDEVYKHGLSPPSDMRASDTCPRSGGKGLCTSLCDNSCTHCVERHLWDKCHMFGLGIYLGDLAQKSHRYCSQPELHQGRRRYRMIQCSVLLGRPLQLEAHLTEPHSMHDVQSLRAFWRGELEERVSFIDGRQGWSHEVPVDQHDLLYVKGLGCQHRPGVSVVNSEFVAFHPYQCLPRYEIVYEI